MAISKAQWEKIEQELTGSYGTVELKLKDTKLTLCKKFIKENQLAIAVYIDGEIMPIWGWPKHEKFNPNVENIWHKRTKAKYTPKQQKSIIKCFGKRRAKQEYPELEAKHVWYDCCFTKFSVLKRQYQKLDGLDVIAIGCAEVIATDETEA